MKYAHQYMQSAKKICDLYDGDIPLSSFLKQYFSQHKKFGSKDRKYISHLCYCCYRLGHAVRHISFEERAKLSVFLCQDTPGVWEPLFEEDWVTGWDQSLDKRIVFAREKCTGFSVDNIFPWQKELNTDFTDHQSFSRSHLTQPDLFLRLRPGKASTVKKKLDAAGMMYGQMTENCIALPNGSRIEEIVELDSEAVVQDHSSQRIGELMQDLPHARPLQVWDCCAASGGKSILAYDVFASLSLSVSDIRESIIRNLRKRFDRAGVKAVKIFVADMSKPQSVSPGIFDLVICDVPCTGSGTWGRTPEQLFFFKEEKIKAYAVLQKKIVSNVLPHIKPGGYLLYITCSVFSEENERIIEGLPADMNIVEMKWLSGYDKKADSMFAALLRKGYADNPLTIDH